MVSAWELWNFCAKSPLVLADSWNLHLQSELPPCMGNLESHSLWGALNLPSPSQGAEGVPEPAEKSVVLLRSYLAAPCALQAPSCPQGGFCTCPSQLPLLSPVLSRDHTWLWAARPAASGKLFLHSAHRGLQHHLCLVTVTLCRDHPSCGGIPRDSGLEGGTPRGLHSLTASHTRSHPQGSRSSGKLESLSSHLHSVPPPMISQPRPLSLVCHSPWGSCPPSFACLCILPHLSSVKQPGSHGNSNVIGRVGAWECPQGQEKVTQQKD